MSIIALYDFRFFARPVPDNLEVLFYKPIKELYWVKWQKVV